MKENHHYWIKKWGEGYFDINPEGHVIVKPERQNNGGDLYALMRSLVEQGIEAPILIRFNGILRDRIKVIHGAFQSAIKEFNYRGAHRMVFPIKVNPQRHVVENVHQAGKANSLGLEVGSKPELMAVLALETNHEMLLLCNGYKDAEYISLALMSNKLGRNTLIIIEQMYELKLVLDTAEQLGVEPQIGFRMKLSSTGSGRWKSSGGEQSKFGLTTYEIMNCVEMLQSRGKTQCVKLLHFHLGSQITAIVAIKKALQEATRMYTQLAAMLPSLNFFDVGGGLAVDYDGTKSLSESSMNYSIEEYSRDVVSAIGEACLAAGIPDPVIVTESGRAVVSHHSVLITEVIDVPNIPKSISEEEDMPNPHEFVKTLKALDKDLSLKNCRETFHDVMEIKERVISEFVYGKLTLKERAYAEKLCRILLTKVRTFYQQSSKGSEELDAINKILMETYFCNFSVFQSLPDSWAIGQLFPVMPIQRLNEEANHQAVLVDLTCDSDGKLDSFIDDNVPSKFINMHDYHVNGPYFVGIFLVGAYQEIIGNLHNLFGDTNVVHAELGPDGEWELSRLVEGDTIEEVLHYVQYNTERLMTQLHELIEKAQKAGRITLAESAQVKKKFKQTLESYTYLVV